MVFLFRQYCSRKNLVVFLSSRDKTQQVHDVMTMDSSKWKISPAVLQKTMIRILSKWYIFSKEPKVLLYHFQNRLHYYSHFGNDSSSVSKCGSSSYHCWLAQILLHEISAHTVLNDHPLLIDTRRVTTICTNTIRTAQKSSFYIRLH